MTIKENLKQFFGPTWKSGIVKIVLGVVLFYLVDFIHALTWPVVDYWASGWPLYYSESWGPCPPGAVCYKNNIFALIFDVVFWYLVLCVAVFVFKKIKRKSAAE